MLAVPQLWKDSADSEMCSHRMQSEFQRQLGCILFTAKMQVDADLPGGCEVRQRDK